MIVPGYKIEAINRMGARLRTTLKRCDPQLPESLRLMAVHLTKEGIIWRLRGSTEIHPGMKKMAKWGGCCERQARRNLNTLESWGVVTRISYIKGGRRATRLWIEPEQLIRVMMTLGANPHPDLISEIRDICPAVNPDINPDITPGQKPGHMSAGILYVTEGAPRPSGKGGSDV